MTCKWVSSIDDNVACNRCADESGYCIFHKNDKNAEENEEFISEIKNQKISNFRGFIFNEKFVAQDVIDYKYKRLSFTEVQFIKEAIFNDYEFKYDTDFNYTLFEEKVSFKRVTFYRNCSFKETKFVKENIGKKIFEKVKFKGQNLVVNNVENLPRMDGLVFSNYSKFILTNIHYEKEDYLYGKVNFKIARIQAQKIGDHDRIGYYYYNERNYGSKIMKITDYPNKREYLSAKFYDSLSRYAIGYGEKPWNILIITILVISIFALLYMLTGLMTSSGDYIGINLSNISKYSISEIINIYVNLWYFSMVTFATVGYGDMIVINTMGKILVCIEVFFGVTLAATWASVIIKRMIR